MKGMGTFSLGMMFSLWSIGRDVNSLCACSAEARLQLHQDVTWWPAGSKAWVMCRSHCWNLRALVPGSPGSSFGNSETSVCRVFKIMFSSPMLGMATGACGSAA